MVEIVPVHTDVQNANRDRMFPDVLEQSGQPICEMHAAPLHSYEGKATAVGIALCDLMSDASQRTLNRIRGQNLGGLSHKRTSAFWKDRLGKTRYPIGHGPFLRNFKRLQSKEQGTGLNGGLGRPGLVGGLCATSNDV